MDAQQPIEQTPKRRRSPTTIVAFLVVAAVAAVGIGSAVAQTGTPEPKADAKAERKFGKHGFKHGMRGFGFGALHGEFTTRAPGDGFQVVAMQRGEVTAVDADSITVRSEDDYTRTYVVNDDTLVNAGDEGIGDVKRGDTVHVMAIVTDGDARAVRISDGTQMQRLKRKWMPRRTMRDGEGA